MRADNKPQAPDGKSVVPLLATQAGVDLMLHALAHMGATCPTCGYGTRVTSKRWAKCKRCGERVERRGLPEMTSVQLEAASQAPGEVE